MTHLYSIHHFRYNQHYKNMRMNQSCWNTWHKHDSCEISLGIRLCQRTLCYLLDDSQVDRNTGGFQQYLCNYDRICADWNQGTRLYLQRIWKLDINHQSKGWQKCKQLKTEESIAWAIIIQKEKNEIISSWKTLTTSFGQSEELP